MRKRRREGGSEGGGRRKGRGRLWGRKLGKERGGREEGREGGREGEGKGRDRGRREGEEDGSRRKRGGRSRKPRESEAKEQWKLDSPGNPSGEEEEGTCCQEDQPWRTVDRRRVAGPAAEPEKVRGRERGIYLCMGT